MGRTIEYIAETSKEHGKLAESELYSSGAEGCLGKETLFLLSSPPKSPTHLAFLKGLYKILFSTKKESLVKVCQTFAWNSVYQENFSVHMQGDKETEKKVAKIIFDSLKNPRVKLKDADTQFIIFEIEELVYLTLADLSVQRNKDNKWEERKNQHLPESHPVSLHPKLARVMINLLATQELIVDPMCGTGALLSEALLTGHDVKGGDCDPLMIEKSRKNIEWIKNKYAITKKYDLEVKNFFSVSQIPYLVTDLPFGKNTKNISDDFNKRFFLHLSKVLTKRAVIGMIHKGIVLPEGLYCREKFEYYVHKSLSKDILVIEKQVN